MVNGFMYQFLIFYSVSHLYGPYQRILSFYLNKAKPMPSIPYLAFGTCRRTSMFYDTIRNVSWGEHK